MQILVAYWMVNWEELGDKSYNNGKKVAHNLIFLVRSSLVSKSMIHTVRQHSILQQVLLF